jgi:hypothetical protein
MSPGRMYQAGEPGREGGGEARRGSGGAAGRHGWGAGFSPAPVVYIQSPFRSPGKIGSFLHEKGLRLGRPENSQKNFWVKGE